MGFKTVAKFFSVYGIWIACALIFFLSTFFLTRFTHFFISPDETGSAFFARAFAHTGSFRVFDGMNEWFEGVLHPRSVITDGAYLIPGSFLGLTFLYGSLMKIFGSWSLTFLTPVIVVIAMFAWNQILERWFDRRVALIASILTLFHPALWYYSARGLMPNVLFVCCAIFSVWFLTRLHPSEKPSVNLWKGKKEVFGLLAGLFFGLALFVRLSEVYWLMPLMVALLIAVRKTISARVVIFYTLGLLSVMGLVFVLNAFTYGHPLTFGYTFVSSVQPSVLVENVSGVVLEKRSFLLPFGFHPRAIFWHTWDYALRLFWWLTIPAFFALPIVFKDHKQKIYTLLTIGVALWLCVWYGSWRLNDNPDPTQITIANSYVRYWLPVFVLSTPLIATSILWIAKHTRSKKQSAVLVCACILMLVGLNARSVFFAGQDALVRVVATLEQSEQIRDRVFMIVPEESVIVTDRSDKLFFPGRHVLVPLRSDRTYAAIPRILTRVPVYYYGITLPPEDLTYLNQRKFASLGLQITFMESFGVESLYHIKKRE